MRGRTRNNGIGPGALLARLFSLDVIPERRHSYKCTSLMWAFSHRNQPINTNFEFKRHDSSNHYFPWGNRCPHPCWQGRRQSSRVELPRTNSLMTIFSARLDEYDVRRHPPKTIHVLICYIFLRWVPNPVPDEACFAAIKTGVDAMPAGTKMVLNSG